MVRCCTDCVDQQTKDHCIRATFTSYSGLLYIQIYYVALHTCGHYMYSTVQMYTCVLRMRTVPGDIASCMVWFQQSYPSPSWRLPLCKLTNKLLACTQSPSYVQHTTLCTIVMYYWNSIVHAATCVKGTYITLIKTFQRSSVNIPEGH